MYPFDVYRVWVIKDGILSRLEEDDDAEERLEAQRLANAAHISPEGVVASMQLAFALRTGDVVIVKQGPYLGTIGELQKITGSEVVIKTEDNKTIRVRAEWVSREF